MSTATQHLATINAAGQCWGFQHNGQQAVATPAGGAWHVSTRTEASSWTNQLATTAGIVAEALQLEDDDRATGRSVEPFAVYLEAAHHAAGQAPATGILGTPRLGHMIAANLRNDWPQITALAKNLAQLQVDPSGVTA